MAGDDEIIKKIKGVVMKTEPGAKVILYGSHARGDFNKNSDYDILILLDKSEINREDETNVKYPLYDLEFETSKIS